MKTKRRLKKEILMAFIFLLVMGAFLIQGSEINYILKSILHAIIYTNILIIIYKLNKRI